MKVTVDERKRVTLGDMARHGQYLVREEPGGVIIMEPAIIATVPASRWPLSPELVALFDRLGTRRRTSTR